MTFFVSDRRRFCLLRSLTKIILMEGFYELNHILNQEIKRYFIFSDFKIKKEYLLGKTPSIKVDGTDIIKYNMKFRITVTKEVLSSRKQMILWCKRAACIMHLLRNLPAIRCKMNLTVDYNPTRKKSSKWLSEQFYKEMGIFFAENFFREMVLREMQRYLKSNKVPWDDMPLHAFVLPETITFSGENKYFEAIDSVQNIASEMKKFLKQNSIFLQKIDPQSRMFDD